MNPTIKQLALEAGGSHYPDVNTMQLVKFAELIVLKCADIADTAEPFLASDLIKQHFGVEQ
jgi:hypothetical protein